jgi:flagellum-specific peptidoglycan hydrolase FlgJ
MTYEFIPSATSERKNEPKPTTSFFYTLDRALPTTPESEPSYSTSDRILEQAKDKTGTVIYSIWLEHRTVVVSVAIVAGSLFFYQKPNEAATKPNESTKTEIPKKPTKPKSKPKNEQPRASKNETASIMPTNENAPISRGQLSKAEANAYIEQWAETAKTEAEKFGIPASISLAQGLVESRGGTSKLARNNKNHFGIKCHKKAGQCRTGHCSNATDDSHKDFFRIYPNAMQSWRAHSVLLSNNERYNPLFKSNAQRIILPLNAKKDAVETWTKAHQNWSKTHLRWAYGLDALGYATDDSYAEKLIGMIAQYDLTRFD